MTGSWTRRRFIGVSAAAAGLSLVPFRAHAAADVVRWRGGMLGADASLVLHMADRERAHALIRMVVAEARRLERIFSLYRADSDLVRLNRDGFLVLPAAEFVDLLQQSRALSAVTDGRFDPGVQPLFDLYRRHFAAANAAPSGPPAAAVAQALATVGVARVSVSNSRIELPKGAALTLNGIAQGYITDCVVALLKGAGVAHALVNMGEIGAVGGRDRDTSWRVGIDDPLTDGAFADVVELQDRAIATSSPLGFRFDRGGRFSHLIDPRSGLTPQRWASVSVVSATATKADALSTAFALMDEGEIQRIAGRATGTAVHLVRHDGKAFWLRPL